jgi:hypothetical protein
VEKVWDVKYYVKIYFYSTVQFSQGDISVNFLLIFGKGFEVLIVARIQNVVSVRTPNGLIRTWL